METSRVFQDFVMPPRPKGEKTQQQKRRAVIALQRRRKVMDYWLNKGKQDVVIDGKMRQYAPPSFREIGDALGVNRTTVMYDLETALAELSAELKAEIEVDVKKEFARQLDFAKELREAAREYLTVDGEINFADPREDEVVIVVRDHDNLNEKGKPTLKSIPLTELLAGFAENGLDVAKVKMEPMTRQFALEYALKTISSADGCIDKFAKLGGEYTKEKENPQDAAVIARKLTDRLIEKGADPEEARMFAAQEYGIEHQLIG